MRNISSLSIAINTSVSSDVSGFTDAMDLPLNSALSDKVLSMVQQTLLKNGYSIADNQVSVGMAHSDRKYYVIATENDRKLELEKLESKPGPYLTERLKPNQLESLFGKLEDKDDIPAIVNMGFGGDAVLVLMIQGRLIGSDKSLGTYLSNAAIVTLYILGGGGSFGGSPELLDTDDSFRVQLRLYSNASGDILWQSDTEKTNKPDNLLAQIHKLLKTRLPVKR